MIILSGVYYQYALGNGMFDVFLCQILINVMLTYFPPNLEGSDALFTPSLSLEKRTFHTFIR